MLNTRTTPVFVLLWLSLAFTGCSVRPRSGRASMQILEPIGSVSPAPKAHGKVEASAEEVVYIPAQALKPLAPPAYPANALVAGTENCTLYVTVTIDGDGRVSDISRSWRGLSSPTPLYEEFFRSIVDVSRQWVLQGARQVYYTRSADGERLYQRTEKVSESFDMKFTFESTGAVH
jgi:hypothetical protein